MHSYKKCKKISLFLSNYFDLGLRTQFVADDNYAISMTMFTALAFVRQDDVFAVFAEVCESTDECIPYMEDTNIGAYRYKSRQKPGGLMVFKRQWCDPLFAHLLWNFRERTIANEPRTNNHLEGWHRSSTNIITTYLSSLTSSERNKRGLRPIQNNLLLAGFPLKLDRRQAIQNASHFHLYLCQDFTSQKSNM